MPTGKHMRGAVTRYGKGGSGRRAVAPLPANPSIERDPADPERRALRGESARVRGSGRRRLFVSNVLLALGVVLLLVAGGLWGYSRWQYHEQDVANSRLASFASVSDASTSSDDGSAKAPVDVDWKGLKEVNADVVGWVYVPDTVVNYPVYQGTDNDYYLHHTAEGQYTLGGQVFMDYENTAPGLVDGQTVIYGHHLISGQMFYPLFLLKDQEVFDATPTIWYLTEQRSYELEPLFVYYTQPEDGSARTTRFESDERLRSYLAERLPRAVASRPDAAKIISGVQHVMTMSTCNYYDGYGRSLLVCVPKAEAAAVLAAAR